MNDVLYLIKLQWDVSSNWIYFLIQVSFMTIVIWQSKYFYSSGHRFNKGVKKLGLPIFDETVWAPPHVHLHILKITTTNKNKNKKVFKTCFNSQAIANVSFLLCNITILRMRTILPMHNWQNVIHLFASVIYECW